MPEYHPNSVDAQLASIITKLEILEEKFPAMEEKLNKMESQLDMWGFGITIIKFIVGAVVLIVTLKIGDIPTLFSRLFSASP